MEPNFQGPLVADPPSVFGYISGAYGPSTARYGRGGSPPRGLRKKLTLLPQSIRYRSGSACGLRTGSARAPGEEEPPALELPDVNRWPSESLPLTGHRLERPTPAIQGESIADGLPVGA